MKFLSSGLFVITFWSILFCILFFFVLWCAYDEISTMFYLVGNQIDATKDMRQTLERLIAQNKLISAKDYFGFYISYYNNFILILSAIIGLSGISSFFYFQRKNKENMHDIESKTKEEIKNYLKNGEVDIKKLIQEVIEEQITLEREKNFEDTEKEINELKTRLEKLENINNQDEEIPL